MLTIHSWPEGAAVLLGVSADKLRSMAADGSHPRVFKVGARLLTTSDDLAAWMARDCLHMPDSGQKRGYAAALRKAQASMNAPDAVEASE